MEILCSACQTLNPPQAHFCMQCGRPVVAPRDLPDGSRVVITGMGAVTPLGHSLHDNWEALLGGVSGISETTQIPNADKYPCRFSAGVKDFNPDDYMDHKLARRITELSQYALAAARMAYEDASLDETKFDFNPQWCCGGHRRRRQHC